ncbi:MAG: lysine transporter LysE [Sphingobacteriales bacterium]|nr:MAG: lysine transporter LysE [Sphingobacteriales bacterium]
MGFILALSVGPVIFTIIKQSINNGYRGGFSFVIGVWLSDIFLVILSNFFSEWVATILQYKRTIGYVGSIFLIAMGIFFVFFKKVIVTEDNILPELKFRKRDVTKIALSGFLINTLNPSVFIFWLLYATTTAAKHNLKERILIFSVCLLVNMLADVLKVLMAGKLRQRLTVKNITIINKLSGSILLGFGIALLYGALFLANKVN